MAFIEPPTGVTVIRMTPEQYARQQQNVRVAGFPIYSYFQSGATMVQDFMMKKLQTDNIEFIKANIPGLLDTDFGVADAQKAGGATGSIGDLRAGIERVYKGLYDNWKAGVWHGVGSAYSGAMEQFLATGQLLYAYKSLMYHTAVTTRMQRYWNTVYSPQVPDASMAWHLYRRGYFNYGQFEEHAAYDGWTKEGAAQLNEIMNVEPTPYEAFAFWARGLISEATRDSLYFAGGYETKWHKNLTELYYTGFRVYDLARLADFIELDQTWALKKLKAAGMRDEDVARTWQMLQMRPLREEVRAVQQKWLWRYRFGRCTLNQLKNELIELGVKPKERELLVEKAELDYEDEIVDEWIEVLRWRFRTAIISEDDFKLGLLDLGIREEKANLIVETEKAMGYYGYY